ncbi:IPT/TIG domain-containing protein [Termitidicoccus mucosus]
MKNKTQTHPVHRLALRGLFALIAIGFAALPARAALVAEDNFDSYTAGSSPTDQNGGTGWGGGWVAGGAAAVLTLTDDPGNLITYTLDDGTVLGSGTSGVTLVVSSTGTATSLDVNPAISRNIADAVTDGSDVFVSFIFKYKNTAQSDGGTFSSGNQMFQLFALDGSPSTNDASAIAGITGQIGARVNNSNLVTSPQRNRFAATLRYGQTYFMVVKYTGWSGSAYRSVRVWLDPTTNDETTTDQTVSVVDNGTSGGSASFNGLRLRVNGLNTSRYYIFDALRIGTTWDAVVGTPTLPAPVISSITAPGGQNLTNGELHPGDTLTLTGENFTATSTVTIGGTTVATKATGGTEADFDAHNKIYTELTITLPVGAVGESLELVVTNAGGSTTAAQILHVTAPPAITGVAPAAVAPGGNVTITGQYLSNPVSVTAGGHTLTVNEEQSNDTAIVAALPEDIPMGNHTITVTTAGGSANSTAGALNVAPVLTVNNLNLDGAAPGEVIEITGKYLDGATVTIGGVGAPVIWAESSDTLLRICVPDGTADGTIVLVNDHGTETLTGRFTVRAPAALIASDDFESENYTVGALYGQDGGSGWGGAWTGNANNLFSIIDDDSHRLTYTLDNGAVLGGGRAIRLAATANNALARLVETPVTGGSDVFMSFIFKVTWGAQDGNDLGAQIFSSWAAIPAARVGDSTFDTTTAGLLGVGTEGRLGARVGTSSSGQTMAVGAVSAGGDGANRLKVGQVYFAVFRYSGWNGTRYTRCQAWLNPGVDDEPNTDPNMTVIAEANTGNSTGFGGIGVRTNALSSSNAHYIDHIRVGTSWSMVVSTPKSVVAEITPEAVHPGDIITIRGAYLMGLQSVTIGGINAEIIDSTYATIRVRVPAGTAGVDKEVSLVTGSGPLTAPQKLTVTLTPPVIDDVGIAGGAQSIVSGTVARNQTITITGSYFTTTVLDVKIAGILAPEIEGFTSTDDTIKVKVPDTAPAGPASLTVTTDGGSDTVTDVFTIDTTIAPPPVLFDVAPQSTVTIKPGDTLTLTGENFISSAGVKVNGVTAEIASLSDGKIVVTVPAGSETAGGVTVTLETAGGAAERAYPGWIFSTVPVIFQQPPEIQPTAVGRSANLVVTATGTPDLATQWQYLHPATKIWLPISNISGTWAGSVARTSTTSMLSLTGSASLANTERLLRCAVSTRLATVYSATATMLFMENLLPAPSGIAIATGTGGDKIYVSDTTLHTIQEIVASGSVTTWAGLSGASGAGVDGTGTDARFAAPRGLSLNGDGVLLVADTGNHLLRAVTLTGSTGGVVTTIGTGTDASFASPAGLASLDTVVGVTYIADTGNHLIKKITAAGEVSIVAGGTASGTNNGALLDAQFNAPASVAVDVSGSYVYVADTGNHLIRLIDLSGGVVSTLAGTGTAGADDGDALTEASFNAPRDLVVDESGDIYVADTGNSRIRVITGGTVVTLAGDAAGLRDGSGANAWFRNPAAITLKDGVLYVADTGNGVIRRIAADEAATVTTLEMFGPPAAVVEKDTSPHGFPESGHTAGGGGAPTAWLLTALAVLTALRLRRRR